MKKANLFTYLKNLLALSKAPTDAGHKTRMIHQSKDRGNERAEEHQLRGTSLVLNAATRLKLKLTESRIMIILLK